MPLLRPGLVALLLTLAAAVAPVPVAARPAPPVAARPAPPVAARPAPPVAARPAPPVAAHPAPPVATRPAPRPLRDPTALPRVPLAENFSAAELVGTAALVAFALSMEIFQSQLVELRGEPLIGDPWAWERTVSDALYRPGAGRWLAGVPDVTGDLIAPWGLLGFYMLDAAAYGLAGRSLRGGRHPDHEFLALAEAFAVTMAFNKAAKIGVGRVRPRLALARPDAPSETDEEYVSFFSGHSSASFSLASFVHRDLSDWLVAGPLADSAPAGRLWVGRVLPGLALYGAAGVVAYSRVVDQAHYVTDVAVGALVGTAVTHLVYALHFDEAGRPRRRFLPPVEVRVVAYPGGVGVSGRF